MAFDGENTLYLVIDCARPTASGEPQPYTPASSNAQGSSGTALALGVSPYIQPVVLATARPDGDVIHQVQNGQSLWSIAIAYETKIEQIRRYNYITDLTIYSGQKSLVQKGATQPPPTPSETAVATPTLSPWPTPSPTPSPASHKVTVGSTGGQNDILATQGTSWRPSASMMGVVGLLIFSILLGGLIARLTDKKE